MGNREWGMLLSYSLITYSLITYYLLPIPYSLFPINSLPITYYLFPIPYTCHSGTR